MNRTRLGAAIISAVVITAATAGSLVACQGNPSASQQPTATPTQSASPTPSPSPTTTSPEDLAVEEASSVTKDYYRELNAALQDPEDYKLEDLEDVAISSALMSAENAYNVYKYEGRHSIGSPDVEIVKVLKVDLTNKPKANPPVYPTVDLLICLDSTDVNVVDKDGKSLSTPDRRLHNLVRVGAGTAPDDSDKWLVWFTEFKEKSC